MIKDEYARDYIFNDFLNPQLSISYARDYFIADNIRSAMIKKFNLNHMV